MILVDTSAWIDFFRGRGELANRVDALIDSNDAALCGPVLTELRIGLRSPAERRKVLQLLSGCPFLDQPDHLWDEAGELGYYLRRRGTTVKSMDLLIAAHALSHSVPVLSRDRDFSLMRRAGLGLLLAE